MTQRNNRHRRGIPAAPGGRRRRSISRRPRCPSKGAEAPAPEAEASAAPVEPETPSPELRSETPPEAAVGRAGRTRHRTGSPWIVAPLSGAVAAAAVVGDRLRHGVGPGRAAVARPAAECRRARGSHRAPDLARSAGQPTTRGAGSGSGGHGAGRGAGKIPGQRSRRGHRPARAVGQARQRGQRGQDADRPRPQARRIWARSTSESPGSNRPAAPELRRSPRTVKRSPTPSPPTTWRCAAWLRPPCSISRFATAIPMPRC